MCTVALTIANTKFRKQRGRADNVNTNTWKQPEGMPPIEVFWQVEANIPY